MEFLQTPAGQQPGAAAQWLEDNPQQNKKVEKKVEDKADEE